MTYMESSSDFLVLDIQSCSRCELSKSRTHSVPGDYGPKNGICFVGEAPGHDEDIQGRPFVGRSGKLLNQMLEKIGLHRDLVSVLNIVKCRPPGNRTPTDTEMKFCGDLWLPAQLNYLKPKIIIPLGSVALRYFFPKARISRDKGKLLFTTDGKPVFPLFHPAYILRNGKKALEEYLKDFIVLKEILNKLNYLPGPEVISDSNDFQKSDEEDLNTQTSLNDFLP